MGCDVRPAFTHEHVDNSLFLVAGSDGSAEQVDAIDLDALAVRGDEQQCFFADGPEAADGAWQEWDVTAQFRRRPAMLTVENEQAVGTLGDEERNAQTPIPGLRDREDELLRTAALQLALIGVVDRQPIGRKELDCRRFADRRRKGGHPPPRFCGFDVM
jgi:hypothetical protein